MRKKKAKKGFYTFFSIVAGITSAGLTFFFLILIFFLTGLFGWSDGGEKEYLERLEKTTNITFVISIVLALVTGIYVIYRLNKISYSKKDSSPADTV